MSSSKMNNFLHRMLNKSTCEESESQPAKGQKKSNAIRSGFPKGNWIKKLGNYSPNKHQVPSTPPRTNTMKAVDKSSPSNPDAVTLRKTSSSPSTPLEMPDLESIIREFERGFLSPTKNDSPADGCKQNNFVKKIVAAFEVKYNTYSDLKMAQETEENHEGSKADSHEASKKKAWIFGGSPFKTNLEESKFDKRSDNCSPLKQSQVEGSAKSTCCSPLKENSEVCKRRSGVFVSPFRNLFEETAAEDEIQKENNRRSGIFFSPSKDKKEEDAKSRRRSGIFSSPFNRRDSKDTSGSSEIYSSPVKLDRQDSKDSSSDCSSLFKFDKEESFRKSDFHFAPLKISSLDDTKNIGDIELDVTLPEPEETISLNGSTLPKTSTRMDEFANENSVPPGVEKVSTRIDKTPKIVGAFLKKPIEVEDTSIDWIPITGKKLPRKKSLKKLLYSLTGKKLERKGKLFSSERNLNEEPRELQDSGYDERSCSSSSLSSLVSVSEVLMQQENGYAEPERKSSLKTFRSRNSIDEEEEEDEAFCERHRSSSLPYRKQLLLTEVPRENVKLDLGPCYPSPKVVTMSLDRKAMSKKARSPSPIYDRLPRLPKHPNLSKIPKHPFVSLTKMDDALLQGSRDNSNAEYPRGEESSIVVKNDLYEVEFRRSCDDLYSSASRRSSSSAESNYDVPRRFLSKSENEISSLFKSAKDKNGKETIYDVPRPRSAERPKSSVFEEAVALKRRCFSFEKRIGGNIYAIPRDLELHHDVTKTMNAKIGLNNAAVRSLYDLTRAETRSAF